MDEIVKAINMSDVDRNDRPMMREIIRQLIEFDDTIPKLETNIVEAEDHYILEVRGYKSYVDLKRFHDTFLRGSDRIVQIECTPTPDTGKGPVFVLKVAGHNYVGVEGDEVYELAQHVDSMEIASVYNDSDVARADRPATRAVVRGLITFNSVMPKLTIRASKKKDVYNIAVLGWNSGFDLAKWYAIFLAIDRDSKFEKLSATQCAPSVPDMGPILLVEVTKTEFTRSVVDKSRRRKRMSRRRK